MVRREARMEVKVDKYYPQEPKHDEDGGGSQPWPVSEAGQNGDKEGDHDAYI
jgi:hypothetical protein